MLIIYVIFEIKIKEMAKSKEELEDEGLLEICKNCSSLHLIEHSHDQVECRDCGAVNYTTYIKESDLKTKKSNGEES